MKELELRNDVSVCHTSALRLPENLRRLARNFERVCPKILKNLPENLGGLPQRAPQTPTSILGQRAPSAAPKCVRQSPKRRSGTSSRRRARKCARKYFLYIFCTEKLPGTFWGSTWGSTWATLPQNAGGRILAHFGAHVEIFGQVL